MGEEPAGGDLLGPQVCSRKTQVSVEGLFERGFHRHDVKTSN